MPERPTIELTIEELIETNRPMAQRLARRYSNGEGIDPDLEQVAELGLFLAAKRFDPATGPFRPFALATIVGELKKHLRSNGWTVKVPRRLQEASITVAAAAETLEQRLQRSPTPQDIAEETGLSLEDVLRALQVRNARFASEQPDDDPPVDERFAEVDLTIDLDGAAATLSSENRHLISLRFNDEMTQRQIASELKISQSQVHRRLAGALDELRDAITPTGAEQ